MSTSEELTDSYLAQLLARDAEKARSGVSRARQKPSDAPKPNLRFLRNILRDTGSHNAALLAKEARASSENENSRKRKNDAEDGEEYDRHAKRRRGDRPNRWSSVLGGSGLLNGGDRASKKKSSHRDASAERSPGRRIDTVEKSKSHRSERHKEKVEDKAKSHRRRSRSRSPRRRRHERHRQRSPSRSPERRSHRADRHSRPDSRKSRSSAPRTPDSDSDPLESIIGPQPASSQPRGRGAASRSSGIDARFADPSYNPRNDTQASGIEEDDDWNLALSGLRDRARWRAIGADRLRSAGYSETQVKKWEGNSGLGEREDKEPDADNVVWRKQGESREWDRGKVLLDDGGVGTKATWTKGDND